MNEMTIVVAPGVELKVMTEEWMPEDRVLFASPDGSWDMLNLTTGQHRHFNSAEVLKVYKDSLRYMGYTAE